MSAPRVAVPAALLDPADRDETWTPWVQALPRLVGDLLEDWGLTLDGASSHGMCALVLPVRTEAGVPAALKVGWPHDEARHEHLALQHWHGRGAVALLRADPHRFALLLERARTTPLTTLDDLEACAVVGRLYGQLHVAAPPQLDRLSDVARDWADRLERLPRAAPVPRRLVEQAASLARDLAHDADGSLVHTDLHDANVLAADRAPWLAIDPKPLSGEPAFEVAPLLWNRWPEVVASGDVRWRVRRRLDTVVDVAGLDPGRARDWVVVREIVQALWSIEAAVRRGEARLRPDAQEWVTRAVTIAKAVQD